MDILERVVFFGIGGGVGFILGYIVARLREIKEELDEVDDIVKNQLSNKDENGFVRYPVFANIMLLVVLSITVYAAFATQKTNNHLDETVSCLTRFNTDQNTALKARDKAIRDETNAEIELWGLYNRLYKEGTSPDATPQKIKEIQDTLATAIRQYRLKLIDTQSTREQYKYGEPDILANCKSEEENAK